jgi:hypothetical protein
MKRNIKTEMKYNPHPGEENDSSNALHGSYIFNLYQPICLARRIIIILKESLDLNDVSRKFYLISSESCTTFLCLKQLRNCYKC